MAPPRNRPRKTTGATRKQDEPKWVDEGFLEAGIDWMHELQSYLVWLQGYVERQEAHIRWLKQHCQCGHRDSDYGPDWDRGRTPPPAPWGKSR